MTSPQPPADGSSTPPPAMPDLSDLITGPGKPPNPTNPRTRLYIIGGIAGLALLAAGYGLGHATASSGPPTLAAAVADAQAGKLPCGTPSGSTVGVAGGTSGGTATGGQGGFARNGAASFLVARLCSNRNAGPGGSDNGGAGGFGGGFAGRTGLGGLFGPGAVNGTITSLSGSAVTLQTRAGAVTISLPASAKVTKTTSGSLKDLSNGLPVEISTTQDSAGNRTATSIFVLPARTTGQSG